MLPFGLKYAYDVFQKRIEPTFAGLNGVYVLVCDILIPEKEKEKEKHEHDYYRLENATYDSIRSNCISESV